MQTWKTCVVPALLLACSLAPLPACAQTGSAAGERPATVQARADLTAGEVRKVDKENGTVTLRHERIVHLNMPPMTMVFRVTDKGLLDTLRPGDRILFRAEEKNGALTLTEIH
jgi:Cu/Ag efflux protein CusF